MAVRNNSELKIVNSEYRSRSGLRSLVSKRQCGVELPTSKMEMIDTQAA